MFSKMPWSLLKVVQFITSANNNCIQVNRGEFWNVFEKSQGQTPHALAGAGGYSNQEGGCYYVMCKW